MTPKDAPQSVGLLWTSDQLVTDTSTWQHTAFTTDIHPSARVGFEPTTSTGERPQGLARCILRFLNNVKPNHVLCVQSTQPKTESIILRTFLLVWYGSKVERISISRRWMWVVGFVSNGKEMCGVIRKEWCGEGKKIPVVIKGIEARSSLSCLPYYIPPTCRYTVIVDKTYYCQSWHRGRRRVTPVCLTV